MTYYLPLFIYLPLVVREKWNVHVANQKQPENKGKFIRNSFCTSQKSLESHSDILISSRMRANEHHCLHSSAVCLITHSCWDTRLLSSSISLGKRSVSEEKDNPMRRQYQYHYHIYRVCVCVCKSDWPILLLLNITKDQFFNFKCNNNFSVNVSLNSYHLTCKSTQYGQYYCIFQNDNN